MRRKANALVFVSLGAWACGGDGTLTSDGGATDAPTMAVTEVVAGSFRSCALLATGAVECWGQQAVVVAADGGAATVVSVVAPLPTPAEGWPPDTAHIALSNSEDHVSHMCALTTSGAAYCEGLNQTGQAIGSMTTAYVASPTWLPLLPPSAGISAGFGDTCALSTANGIECWGWNLFGQIGTGALSYFQPSTVVSALPGPATTVSTAFGFTCAIVAGNVWCWGDDTWGELGNGTTTTAEASPVQVVGVSGATAIALGGYFACALVSGGVLCWGNDEQGELGDNGAKNRFSLSPVSVVGISDAVELSVGWAHACVVGATGDVHCWGWNGAGAVGDGTTVERDAPVLVALPKALHVSAGERHTCALTVDGPFCWGDDTFGEVGDGTGDGGAQYVASPVKVLNLP